MNEMNPDTVSILYVEDDTSTRLQVLHLLKQCGYRCLVAENGQEGLEQYRQHTPDIVLTDIMMPVMNGLEMARQIRVDYPEVPFIVLTAFDERENMLAAIDISASQFVVKPVDPAKLFSAIKHCMKLLQLRTQWHKINHLEAINTLAGGMAHDFNNLLQMIQGYVDLAKKHADPGSQALKYLKKIEPSSNQAVRLSQQLIALAHSGCRRRKDVHLPPVSRLLMRCSAPRKLAVNLICPLTFRPWPAMKSRCGRLLKTSQ